MKNLKWWQWVLIAFGGLILIGIILPDTEIDETSQDSQQVLSTEKAEQEEKQEEPKPSWEYSESVDEMDNSTTYYAITMSTNEVEFDFPYDGGSKFQLMVRNMDGKNEVLVAVSKGQFASSYSNNNIRVKFDDAEPVNYSYSQSTSGESDLIFINNSSSFIKKLKIAKSVWIEATFFNEGNQIMKFDTDGLTWNR